MKDEYKLRVFVEAQDHIYAVAIEELRHELLPAAGVDMIFPRLADDGPILPPNQFAIRNLDEARAYLAFPTLLDRHRECANVLTLRSGRTACEALGRIGARKPHASLTLFAEPTSEPLFRTLLALWFDNQVDEATIIQLNRVH